MKEFTQYTVAVFIGFSIMIAIIQHYTIQESAQKIENIKTLYELKSNLENKKFNNQIDEYIKNTQLKIDSLENDK